MSCRLYFVISLGYLVVGCCVFWGLGIRICLASGLDGVWVTRLPGSASQEAGVAFSVMVEDV